MKINKHDVEEFERFSLTLTFESKEEALALAQLLNYTPVCALLADRGFHEYEALRHAIEDAHDAVNKDKLNYVSSGWNDFARDARRTLRDGPK